MMKALSVNSSILISLRVSEAMIFVISSSELDLSSVLAPISKISSINKSKYCVSSVTSKKSFEM